MTDFKALHEELTSINENRDWRGMHVFIQTNTPAILLALELAQQVDVLKQQAKEGLCNALEDPDCCCDSCMKHEAIQKIIKLEAENASLKGQLAAKERELAELRIRVTDLFNRHERPTYAEGSNPDTDLKLILGDS